jgi:hypothetical protein
MTGDSPAGKKLTSLLAAMSDSLDVVFKEEMKDPVGFIIVAINKRTDECGYISNVQDIDTVMDLMRATVEQYDETEKTTSKH